MRLTGLMVIALVGCGTGEVGAPDFVGGDTDSAPAPHTTPDNDPGPTTTPGATPGDNDAAPDNDPPPAPVSPVPPVPPVQATGTPGVWEDVTPSSVNLDPNSNPAGNFGTDAVVVDPARANDVYFSVCYQGIWKSSDYGLTWTRVNTGTNGDKIDMGRPGLALGSTPGRDPSTPPILYANSLYGALGMWKSVDGGVSWSDIWHSIHTKGGSDIAAAVWLDVMTPSVDPTDATHLIVGMHGNTQGSAYDDHVFESHDAGESWIDRGPTGNTTSPLLGFVSSTTWIAQGDLFGGGNTQRTTSSGDSWDDVGDIGHPHGAWGMYNAGGGTLFLTGMNGLYTSTNSGASWAVIASTPHTSAIAVTPTTIYASYGWATLGGGDPLIGHVNRATGVYTAVPWPNGMSSGGESWASTTDGTHWIIVGSNWNAGIWRFIEQ